MSGVQGEDALPDPTCTTSASGHSLHWIPAFKVIRDPDGRVPVRVEVDRDRVWLHGAPEPEQPRYLCEVAYVAALVDKLGDHATFHPGFGVLIFDAEPGIERFVSLSRRPVAPCRSTRARGATVSVAPDDDAATVTRRLFDVIGDEPGTAGGTGEDEGDRDGAETAETWGARRLRRQRRPDDVFGGPATDPVMIHRRGEAVALLDQSADLRCSAGPTRAVERVKGFDRPGVIVGLTPRDGRVACTIRAVEHAAGGPQPSLLDVIAHPDRPVWLACLVTHFRPWVDLEAAVGMVRAELARYELIDLDEPARNLGLFEAPPSIMRAGEMVGLALAVARCPIGVPTLPRPPVEHPDLLGE